MNPMVQYHLNNAMNSVRTTDKKARQLMMIELAAKQLALHIAEYEETLAGEDASGGVPPGPSVMGDEGNN
jgi:3-dehydrosphinganine reductase